MFIRVLVHYTVLMHLRNIVLVDGHEWPWRKFALSEHFLVYNIGANTKLYAKSCLSLIIYDMIYDISFHKVDEQASAKLKCIKFSEDAAKCVILSSRDIKTQILETETHVGANSNVMCPTSSYKLSYRREAYELIQEAFLCLPHLHSTPPLGGFPSENLHPVWHRKTNGLATRWWINFENIYSFRQTHRLHRMTA